MAEAARVLEFPEEYQRGTAVPVPAGTGYAEPAIRPEDIPSLEERARRSERARSAVAPQGFRMVSLFAIFGSLLASALMVFVVLAQISYNEIAGETARLSAQFTKLEDQQRRLEITFESVIDMKEVERYARDELGMSKPDADHIAIIRNAQTDKIEVVANTQSDPLHEFGAFISSLLAYLKKGK